MTLMRKRKNDIININVTLCVTEVTVTHFAVVGPPRARVTRAQYFVTRCWGWYGMFYVIDYVVLRVTSTSR